MTGYRKTSDLAVCPTEGDVPSLFYSAVEFHTVQTFCVFILCENTRASKVFRTEK